MEPIRKPGILTLKAAPVSSDGNESDSKARDADPIMLRHPTKREERTSSTTQSLTIAQAPKMRGIGRRKAKMVLFLPYLSASHPPGTWLRRLRTLEPEKKSPMLENGRSSGS